MNKKNYYSIEKFMHAFNLSLEELHVYALIYSFSKNKRPYNGTLNFIQLVTGVKIEKAKKALKALEKKELIREVKTNLKSQNKQYVTISRKKEELDDDE